MLAVWLVITVAGYLLAVLGLHGESLFDRLSTGAPAVPGSDSARAQQLLAQQGEPESLTLVLSGVDVTDPELAAALAPVRSRLAVMPGVASVIDPLALPGGAANPAAAPLVAADGDGFLVVVELSGDQSDGEIDGIRDEVATALRFIRANAREQIGVEDVVEQAALSRRMLEIRFSQVLGRSIREEIQRVRLTWVKQLLVETTMPVEKITGLAGFNNLTHLSKVFRRETGETLSGYRRRHRSA